MPEVSSKIATSQVEKSASRETKLQPDAYSSLISQAVKESTPSLTGKGHRLLSTKRGWGSEYAVTVDGLNVRVGYREPLIDAPFPGVILKNEPNPQYGIRVGESDQVYRKPDQIAQQLGEHARNATAPVLYELARQQGKLSHDTFAQAETIGTTTIATATRPDQSTYGIIYLADAESDKMIRFQSGKARAEDMSDTDIAEARRVLGDVAVQRLLHGIPSQALVVEQTEHDGQSFANVRASNGNNWEIELTSFQADTPGEEPHEVLTELAGVESQATEVVIPDSERLIPIDGYKIDVGAEIIKGAGTPYRKYPSPEARIHMTPDQITQWQAAGGRTADLPIGDAAVTDHPNYQQGLAKGIAVKDNGTQDFHDTAFAESFDPEGYQRDERGLPIRPHDTEFLQAGAVEGIGFYWNYGPNKAADSVVFREKDGLLQVLVIRRNDTGTVALPGGMVDPNEPDVSAAVRELFEEAGLDLQDVPHIVVHKGIVWADPRATRHAWPESTVALLTPDSDRTDNVRLKAQEDEVREAVWMSVTQENVGQLAFSHPGFVMLAAGAWQQQTERVIAKDGRVGRSQETLQEIDRHDERITRSIADAPLYRKQGEVHAQIAQGGEKIKTVLADGITETKNVAKTGDAIITNPGGEQYIMDATKFGKRYESKPGEEGVFIAKGYSRGIDNPWDQPITMMALWGEMQNGAADAIVADTYDPDTQQLGGEPYIIGRAEFRQTYRLDTSGDNLSRFAGRFGRFASNDGSGQLTLSERAVEQQIVDVMQLNPADVLRVERILADRLGTLEQLGAESEQIAQVTHAVNLLRQQMASDVRFLDAAKNV